LEATGGQGTARTCVFCGGPANSREHLLPCWLRRLLPSGDEAVHFRQIGGGKRHEWNRKPFQEKSRIVCHDCNTGWMNDMEHDTAPILKPPITNQVCQFDRDEQHAVATWAVKTCLVLGTSQAGSAIAPGAHFAHVKAGHPPPNVWVWIGSHYRGRSDPINSVFMQRPLTLEPVDDKLEQTGDFGYVCFLAIGGLALVVVGSRYRNRAEVTTGSGPLNQALIEVWPSVIDVILWPPYLMLDQQLIDALMGAGGGFDVQVWPA
jgi:hypothetical protein